MAKTNAPINSHFEFSEFIYFSKTKYKTVQLNTSNELGWYNIFNLKRQENKTQVAPKTNENKFPFNSSMAFQTTKSVKQPYNAGKNLTQKTELPNNIIK